MGAQAARLRVPLPDTLLPAFHFPPLQPSNTPPLNFFGRIWLDSTSLATHSGHRTPPRFPCSALGAPRLTGNLDLPLTALTCLDSPLLSPFWLQPPSFPRPPCLLIFLFRLAVIYRDQVQLTATAPPIPQRPPFPWVVRCWMFGLTPDPTPQAPLLPPGTL